MGLTTMRPAIVAQDMRRVHLPTRKETDPFYLSPEWRQLCQFLKDTRWPDLIIRQGHCCEDPHCKAKHRLGQRIFFDHIVELRDGGAPLDPANVMGRCGSSHSRKTAAARAARLGASADGEGGSKL